MRTAKVTLFIALLILLIPPSFAAVDWTEPALRLTGLGTGPKVRAVHQLKSMPDLNTRLRAALDGPYKLLALDVIAALRLSEFVAEMRDRAGLDESGFFYLTLNSFITPENQEEMYALYLTRLAEASGPPAAKVILLDTLGRVGVEIPIVELKKLLLTEPSPEVNSAAIAYLRLMIQRHGRAGLKPLVPLLLARKDLSRQRKEQILLLSSEMGGE